MAKKQFKLQKVLEYREILEDQLQIEVIKIKTDLKMQETELQAKHDNLMRYKYKLIEIQKEGAAVKDYKTYLDYVGYLKEEIKLQEKVITEINDTLASTIESLKKACKDKRMIEKIKEKEIVKNRDKNNRLEQGFFDEISLKAGRNDSLL